MESLYPHDKTPLTDEALLDRLKLDDAAALREIFDRYHFRLFRVAAGVLKDEEQAKDLVQDVFVDLWNRRQTADIQILPRYLNRAIKFQVLKQIRDGRMKDHHLKLMQNIQFANHTEESIDRQELESMLQKIVNDLSPRCREIFVLSRFENLSHKEISARLNISTKTVEAQIGKALAILRQKFQHIMFLGLLMLFC